MSTAAALLRDREVTAARRILIASGKILHELRAERQRRHIEDIAILGLEQIYPFPEADLEAEPDASQRNLRPPT